MAPRTKSLPSMFFQARFFEFVISLKLFMMCIVFFTRIASAEVGLEMKSGGSNHLRV